MREDWISPWWQAALLPDRWDVCGVKNLPSLSLWHTFTLEQIGNSYLYGVQCDKDDAASLLLFASHDYRGGQRLMHRNRYRARQFCKMYKRLKKMKWEDIDAACSDYIETCTRVADRYDSTKGKPGAVPRQWHLVRMMLTCNMVGVIQPRWFKRKPLTPIEQAWNTPHAVARCIYDSYAESEGDDKLLGIEAQEMLDNKEDYEFHPEPAKVEDS